MAIPGSYLVLKIDGDVVAETTDVNLKAVSKQLDHTSQDSGVNAAFTPGLVKIGIAGKYLYATDGANWDALYNHINGVQMDISLYLDGDEFVNGSGILKKLGLRGADESSLITGDYGIRYYVSGARITTEGGLWLTTEDGKHLITE